MKVVINDCYGGYGLSQEAEELYLQKKSIPYELVEWEEGLKPIMSRNSHDIKLLGDNEGESTYWFFHNVERNDPVLVEVVEELGGERAGDWAAHLTVVEIPDDVEWCIKEYDGNEWVAERHRIWG